MRLERLTSSVLLACTLGCAALPALAQPPAPPKLAAADRQAIIDQIAAALDETYVFPDVADKMEEHVRAQLASGAYDALAELPAFTERLTEDLQSISRDQHLRVFFAPEEEPDSGDAAAREARQARAADQARRDGFCFREAKRLTGNVGYLKLDCFMDLSVPGAGAAGVAAMNFLAGSDAVIFDLRDNGGGSPTMIQLLTSYLFAEPTHLNSFYIRKGDRTEQFWTQGHVQGPRMTEVPVFVLTSSHTFSGAEEFSYNLKNLKRGTLVGETTGGGAHPVNGVRLKGYPIVVTVPFGRAVNPISGTNWEGTGVEPDRKVSAAEALAVAHVEALAAVEAKLTDPEAKAEIAFVRQAMEDRRRPATLSAEELGAYAGTYGPRIITLDGGVLTYQRAGGRRLPLVPVGGDRFLVGDLDDFRLRFDRDPNGAVVRIVGLYPDGREEPHDRGDG